MSLLNRKYFSDEAAAFAHLESILWADGVVCPHCGAVDSAGRLKGVRSKPSKKNPEGVERHGLWKCYACRKQFTCRVGTVFQASHIPLHKMLQAVYLLCSSKKGISSHQLHRTLEIDYKSAWFLSHRIREAMRDGTLAPMGGAGSIVEVDETFIGFQQGANKKTPRTAAQFRNIVMTLVERGGAARSFHIDATTLGQLIPIIRTNISRESHLMTDEATWYTKVGKEFASHGTVNHKIEQYVRYDNTPAQPYVITTNTVEGYYSIFKRGMKGVYQHCKEKHLHRYLAEFDFRYSNRVALGVNDIDRTILALKGIAGKRLTYQRSGHSAAPAPSAS